MLHRQTTSPWILLIILLMGLPPARADTIRITEIVTDPQADHSESSGGNGVVFDAVPGTGSVTTSDEWIELANTTTCTIDLTGWKLDFLDTSATSYVFGTTTAGILRFSGASSLSSFAGGDFLLLGNPPGAMNNSILIELRDGAGVLVDTWDVADANATGAHDESLARPLFSPTEIQGAITPLADTIAPGTTPGTGSSGAGPAPVPEPTPLGLLGLSAAAWIATRLRKASRGCSRT